MKSIEEILLASLDDALNEEDQRRLTEALAADKDLRKQHELDVKIREVMRRKRETSFGPYFGVRVVNRIQNLRKEIDYQIMFFFKKYQLAALGILIAIVAVNVISAEDITVQSVFGLEEKNVKNIVNEADSITFDFYKTLNEQL
jgi:hypothetical protein